MFLLFPNFYRQKNDPFRDSTMRPHNTTSTETINHLLVLFLPWMYWQYNFPVCATVIFQFLINFLGDQKYGNNLEDESL